MGGDCARRNNSAEFFRVFVDNFSLFRFFLRNGLKFEVVRIGRSKCVEKIEMEEC